MNRSVAVVFGLLILSLLASCGDSGSSPSPEPDIEATVEARVAKALAEVATPSPAPAPTSVSMSVPTASPTSTNTPIPTPTVTPIPAPIVQGLGVTFLEIKEAFALAGYTPILCTLPENHDKYECQGEDTLALYRAPNKYVEVLFAGLMNDLRAVGVGFNIDAANQDNSILNEITGASILVAEHIVHLWDGEDRTIFLNSTFQTLLADPTNEITERVGHVSIKAGINSNGWMIILFERSSETEVSYVRKEPSLQVGWSDIKNSYALEGFTSEICLNFTEHTFPLCHFDTTAVQVHHSEGRITSKGYVTYSGRLSELREIGVFTDLNASIYDIKKVQSIAIQYIIPEWAESDTWRHEAISTIKQNPEAVLKTQVGDKEIKMWGNPLNPIIILEIKAAK